MRKPVFTRASRVLERSARVASRAVHSRHDGRALLGRGGDRGRPGVGEVRARRRSHAGAGEGHSGNLAAGTADMDATNLSQLKALSATIGTSGAVTNAFVAYDSTAKDKVSLGGGTNGTTLS